MLSVPYVEQPCAQLGPLRVCAFGVIVAAAVLTGLEIGRRRFRRLGLDHVIAEGFGWYTVVGGFLGAHIFSVLFYFPDEIRRDPLVLLKLWEDISSFGGILGAIIGMWLYFGIKARDVHRSLRWAYVDVAAFVFPISLAIGRIACTLAHDHPGTVTTFPLSVSLESPAARAYIVRTYEGAGRLSQLPSTSMLAQRGFHDLGWYEFLYLVLVLVPVVLLVDRRRRGALSSGTFLGVFILLYMPVRFGLDFLRVSDARYGGLTPAQWLAALLLLALPIWWRLRPMGVRRSHPELEAAASESSHETTRP